LQHYADFIKIPVKVFAMDPVNMFLNENGDKIQKDSEALPHVSYVLSKLNVAIFGANLRQTTGLTFFDSHYATTALDLDRKNQH